MTERGIRFKDGSSVTDAELQIIAQAFGWQSVAQMRRELQRIEDNRKERLERGGLRPDRRSAA